MPPPHLLVIDDQPAIRSFVQNALERTGYQVTTAGDGATALRMFTHRRPDLVLLDLTLPGMSGGEIMTRMRAWSALPMLLMRAYPRTATVVQRLLRQANGSVEKPFELRCLLQTVQDSLRAAGDADGFRRSADRPPPGAMRPGA